MQSGEEKLLKDAAPALIADLLHRFGRARVRVDGISMLPAIRPRDVVLIGHCTIEQIRIADVVLFTVGSRLFVHRVVRIGSGHSGPPFVVTKGDTHSQEDLPIASSQLLGRVLALWRNGHARPEPLPYSRMASVAWMGATRFIQRATRVAAIGRS